MKSLGYIFTAVAVLLGYSLIHGLVLWCCLPNDAAPPASSSVPPIKSLDYSFSSSVNPPPPSAPPLFPKLNII